MSEKITGFGEFNIGEAQGNEDFSIRVLENILEMLKGKPRFIKVSDEEMQGNLTQAALHILGSLPVASEMIFEPNSNTILFPRKKSGISFEFIEVNPSVN